MTDRFLSAEAAGIELADILRRRGTKGEAPAGRLKLVGLACSGGGIRAAAFAIGAIQALSDLKADPVAATSETCFERIDYISSVSGGSYAACSLASAIIREGITLPFASIMKLGTPALLDHIRAHAKLINSRGWLDYFEIIGIWLYSFVTGLLIISPFLLCAAALFLIVFPEAGDGSRLEKYAGLYPQVVLAMAAFFSATYLLFAISYSYPKLRGVAFLIGKYWPYLLMWSCIIIFTITVPLLLRANLPGGYIYKKLEDSAFGFLVGAQEIAFAGLLLLVLASILIPLLIRQQQFVTTKKNRLSAAILAGSIQFLIVVTGVVVPVFLLAVVLTLARWGILRFGGSHAAPEWMNTFGQWLSDIFGTFFGVITFNGAGLNIFSSELGEGVPAYNYVALYLILAVTLFIFTKYGLDNNWTSFHRFYRDRLKSSFIFGDPERPSDASPKISQLPAHLSPYLLVNCTANCVTSTDGVPRPVDEPFVIGPKLVGNDTLGFTNTNGFENASGEFFDLASIAAVSGAAFSPIMGRYTSRSFRMFMSLLAFRLGYWVPNPKRCGSTTSRRPTGRRVGGLYYLKEMIGTTSVTSPFIYLTDGGHVDNSGIYELLRRRCSTIIAIDSEADVDLLFDNISYLIEFAQARLDTRIILSCHKVGTEGGVHCAIGRVFYPATLADVAREGYLVYCKLSLTGDENLDLLCRRRASGEFPYHSTLNQNYDELMFDAYRYLGLHIVDGLITQKHAVEFWDGQVRPLKPTELSEGLLL